MADRTLHAIIPAGGAGTRLWPLSRRAWPKYLLSLDGNRNLLQAACDRLAGVACDYTVVTSPLTAGAVGQSLGSRFSSVQIIAEPSPKNSMPAIGLAAAITEARHGGDALVGSFAADHVIRDEQAFAQVVADAMATAQAGYVVTIGITPTRPDTGYGYIDAGEALKDAPARAVRSFTEKPDAQCAQAYLAQGTYLWNAGMFVARCGVLLDRLAVEHPQLAAGLRRIAAAWDTADAEDVLAREWPQLTAIAIDHAVAEPAAAAGAVAVCQAGTIGWSDVGDYDTLASEARESDGARIVGPLEAAAVESPGALVAGTDRVAGEKVVVFGVPDAVVVREGDVTLVTTRQRAGQIKALTAALEQTPLANLD